MMASTKRECGRGGALLWITLTLACGGAPTHTERAVSGPAVTAEATFEIIEEEVAFDADGRAVHGTLSRPTTTGRRPALLIIAGSGPTDRNWNSPLLAGTNGSGGLIARALSARGVVVLRYDKLGTGSTPIPTEPVRWSDYVSEQRGGLALLAANEHVDARHIFLAGHSEGGAHAIHLAADPGVPLAGLILLASPGRSFENVMLGQIEGQFRAAGLDGADLAAQMDPLRNGFDALVRGETVDPASVSQIPPVQALFAACAAPRGLPFARELLAFEPAAALAHLTLPMLIMNGEHDAQVLPTLDATALADAGHAAGLSDVTLYLPPEANHVFKHEPRPIAELDPASIATSYSAADTDLDPATLTHLVGWLAAHTH